MSGWLRSLPALATPLRSRAVAACLAGARRKGSACQKLPPFNTWEVGPSCCRVVTYSWRACCAAERSESGRWRWRVASGAGDHRPTGRRRPRAPHANLHPHLPSTPSIHTLHPHPPSTPLPPPTPSPPIHPPLHTCRSGTWSLPTRATGSARKRTATPTRPRWSLSSGTHLLLLEGGVSERWAGVP